MLNLDLTQLLNFGSEMLIRAIAKNDPKVIDEMRAMRAKPVKGSHEIIEKGGIKCLDSSVCSKK